MLLNLVIILSNCVIILGNEFKNVENCGKGRNVIRILQKTYKWKEIDLGYLIHPRAVLTVAQSIADLSIKDLQLSETLGFEEVACRNISKIIIHPNYNPCNGSKDFSILIFEPPFMSNHTPICLSHKRYAKNIIIKDDCFPVRYYYARYLRSPNGNCEKQFGSIFEYMDDMNYICSARKDEGLDFLESRTTDKKVCTSLLDEYDHRQYYHVHNYYGIFCKKDDTGDYMAFNHYDYIHEILPWVSQVLKEIPEEKEVE